MTTIQLLAKQLEPEVKEFNYRCNMLRDGNFPRNNSAKEVILQLTVIRNELDLINNGLKIYRMTLTDEDKIKPYIIGILKDRFIGPFDYKAAEPGHSIFQKGDYYLIHFEHNTNPRIIKTMRYHKNAIRLFNKIEFRKNPVLNIRDEDLIKYN